MDSFFFTKYDGKYVKNFDIAGHIRKNYWAKAEIENCYVVVF